MKKVFNWIASISLAACLTARSAEERFQKLVGAPTVGPVKGTTSLQVPFITWGGDMAMFYANGGLKTRPGTIFAGQGLTLNLTPGDDFVKQVRNYMAGRTPFLRGTFRMIGMASEVIGSNPATKGKGLEMDRSEIQPLGVGIHEPFIAVPRSMAEAEQNMRVEFRLLRVTAEIVNPSDFEF